MKLATGIAALTLAVASTYSAQSIAALEIKGSASNPTARCQGALPVFETAIRKRPLAIENEGTAATFVTCSFEASTYDSTSGILMLDTYFSNKSATDANVTCTAVTGYNGGTNEYVSLTTAVPANSTGANPFWLDEDFEGFMPDGLVSISCNLPPGVGVNDTYVFWEEDDA